MAAGVLAALNGSKKRINQRSASFRLMRAFFQARPPAAALLACLHHLYLKVNMPSLKSTIHLTFVRCERHVLVTNQQACSPQSHTKSGTGPETSEHLLLRCLLFGRCGCRAAEAATAHLRRSLPPRARWPASRSCTCTPLRTPSCAAPASRATSGWGRAAWLRECATAGQILAVRFTGNAMPKLAWHMWGKCLVRREGMRLIRQICGASCTASGSHVAASDPSDTLSAQQLPV